MNFRYLFLSHTRITSHFKKLNKPGFFKYSRVFVTMTNKEELSSIPCVDIDPEGVFKYILIRVYNTEEERMVVRGHARHTYHADIYDEFENELKKYGSGLRCECAGGGRINRNEARKTIEIYGYSEAFGPAEHKIAAALCREALPGYRIDCEKV